jgi:hypothetical protein
MTTALDISLANNADFQQDFTLLDFFGATLILNSDSLIHMQARPTADSTDIIFDASLANGLLKATSGTNGTIAHLWVHAAKLRQIAAISGVYDLIVEQNTGEVIRCYAGGFEVIEGVTEL